MKWLFLALIVVPSLELALLFWASDAIGIFPTLALIIATGFIGAFLAKKQGMKAVRDIQDSFGRFQPPGDHLINAAFVLVGGVLLLTPPRSWRSSHNFPHAHVGTDRCPGHG